MTREAGQLGHRAPKSRIESATSVNNTLASRPGRGGEMANPGKLKLNLTGVNGRTIQEAVSVDLQPLSHGVERRITVKPGRSTTVTNLFAEPNGVYRVSIDPPSYLPVSQFVSVKGSGVTPLNVVFPIDARKVKQMRRPTYASLPEDAVRVLEASDTVLSFEGKTGDTLYDAIDDVRRAGLLNIFAKTRATTFANGRSVLSYIAKLTELRGDRFFARIPRELREETKNAAQAGLFFEAPDALHHPPDGFTSAGSYKTPDHYANLQLTFFARGDEWCADIDIDDAGGLGHVFQVLRNTITNRATHPYDIHELLVYHQKLDPRYDLLT
jgi:hypothetical protein